MDWISEFRAVLAKAAVVWARPSVILTALVFSGGFDVVMSLISMRIAGRAMMFGRGYQDVSGLVVVAIAAVLAAPAISSGLWAVSRTAVVDNRASWGDFWGGLGTYYWRLVALALLAGVIFTVIGFAVGVERVNGLRLDEMPASIPLPLLVVYLVGQYLTAPVIPAMVVEGERAISAAVRGISFSWSNAAILAPAVVADIGVSRIVQRLNSAMTSVTAAFFYRSGIISFAVFFVATAVTALASCYFRVLYLVIYNSRRTAEPASVAGVSDGQPQDPHLPSGPQEPDFPAGPPA